MPSFFTPTPHRPNRTNIWPQGVYNLRANTFPVHADSDEMLEYVADWHNGDGEIPLPESYDGYVPGTVLNISAFNTKNWNDGRYTGYFSDSLPGSMNPETSRVTWVVNSPDEQHLGPHLWFSELRQEGAHRDFFGNYVPAAFWEEWDKHCVLWSESSKELVEAIGYSGNYAGSGANAEHSVTYITDDYELPRAKGNQWSTYSAGANVIRIPGAPFFFCYQDLLDCGATGDLGHMLGFQLGGYSSETVWPALNSDGGLPAGLPGGAIIRLKDDFDIDSLPNDQLKALARTMKKYGMMLFDRTNRFRLVTLNDPAWPNNFGEGVFDLLDFEVIDHSSVAVPMFERAYPLEPAPGTIRVGITQTSGSVVSKHETPTGQPIGMHRRFISSWNNRTNVLTEVRDGTLAGRSVWVSIKTPPWGAVAAGTHDAEIDSVFTSLKNTYTNCWFTPYHEPEDNTPELGTPAEYRAMIERFVARKNAVGANNVLLVPILMSYTFRPDSGRNPDDWVVLNSSIPMYGIDFYSNTFDNENLDLSNNSEWNYMYDYMQTVNLDIALGEVGGAIGTSTVRQANFWKSVVNEALNDPFSRVKAICWFDDGTNELGGFTSDPTDELLDAFQASLISDYSYRGGNRRMTPTEDVNTIKPKSLVYEGVVAGPSEWKPKSVITMV